MVLCQGISTYEDLIIYMKTWLEFGEKNEKQMDYIDDIGNAYLCIMSKR